MIYYINDAQNIEVTKYCVIINKRLIIVSISAKYLFSLMTSLKGYIIARGSDTKTYAAFTSAEVVD